MDLGAIVEVAIGIIFMWIVLSLTTIQIQEWISTALDKRARDMEDAIHEMLANPNLKAQFYDHPVIRGLTSKKRRKPSRVPGWFYRYPIVRGFTKEKRRVPSYIPSQQFALSLFDIAMTAGTESSLIQQGILKIRDDLENESKMPPNRAVIEELNLLVEFARSAAATEAGTAITQRTLARLKQEAANFSIKYPEISPAVESALKEAERLKVQIDEVLAEQPKEDLKSALGKVKRGIAALSVISPEVNQTLNALLLNVEEYASQSETHLAKARKNVETWFNDSMDRVSGVFKRYSQRMALIIGFLVALILNVDSVDLTLFLWRDSTVRQVLVAQATNLAAQPQLPGSESQGPGQALQDVQRQLEELNLPVGWGISQITESAQKSCSLFPKAGNAFGIPIPVTGRCLAPPQASDQSNIVLKLGGIFITALAARQGAPFWFDMLKRVVNLRGTGANPVEKDGK